MLYLSLGIEPGLKLGRRGWGLGVGGLGGGMVSRKVGRGVRYYRVVKTKLG